MISFHITEDEREKFRVWREEHELSCTRKSAAIGGAYTYCFTPTGLGDIKVVKCVCGTEVTLTDFENW